MIQVDDRAPRELETGAKRSSSQHVVDKGQYEAPEDNNNHK